MSKTAIIYSGQARSFRRVWENHHWHVWRKFPNPHFFVSVDDDAQAPDMAMIRKKYPDTCWIERHEQPDILEPVVNTHAIAGYAPSAPPQSILRQFWALNRAYDFFQKTRETEKLGEFDLVVRIRPDTHFMRVDLTIPLLRGHGCYTPWWSRWGGCNDRFAVMGPTPAIAYFRTYLGLEALLDAGAPLHPETLLAAHLERAGIASRPLSAEFVTVRMDGSTTLFDPTVVDIADYARSIPCSSRFLSSSH